MDTHQIAKLLQISGILIGTGFGTILLNPQIVGKLAERINAGVFSLGDTFTKRYLTIFKWISRKFHWEHIPLVPFFLIQIVVSAFVLSAWVLLLLGLQRNIVWVVWLSIAIIFAYAILYSIAIILYFKRYKEYVRTVKRRGGSLSPRTPTRMFKPLWVFPVRIIMTLLGTHVAIFVFMILNYLSLLFVLIFRSIAGKDMARRGLIIIGFGLVLAGLILEFSILF